MTKTYRVTASKITLCNADVAAESLEDAINKVQNDVSLLDEQDSAEIKSERVG